MANENSTLGNLAFKLFLTLLVSAVMGKAAYISFGLIGIHHLYALTAFVVLSLLTMISLCFCITDLLLIKNLLIDRPVAGKAPIDDPHTMSVNCHDESKATAA